MKILHFPSASFVPTNLARELPRRRAHSGSRRFHPTWEFLPRSGAEHSSSSLARKQAFITIGPQETIAYVLAGKSFVQWGEHGEHSLTASAGDFLHVPAWLVHREINRSQDTPFHWIVVRSTSEPIVVNLPSDTWD
jgi:hypothetical protein